MVVWWPGSVLSTTVNANDDPSSEVIAVHPMLDSKHQVYLGLYFPDKKVTFSAQGSVGGFANDPIEFDEALGLGETETVAFFQYRWNWGKKWWTEFEYFSTDADNTLQLQQDITWQDITFKEGSFVAAGTNLDVARVFFGRKIFQRPDRELSLGAGLHWLEIGGYIEGELESSIGDSEFLRGEAKTGFPLPNFGLV